MTDAKLTPTSIKAFATPSPLKMIADGGPPRTPAKSSNDLPQTPGSGENSLSQFVSLDPVREADIFNFGMTSADTLHALFDHHW
jgi:hypothetical protein